MIWYKKSQLDLRSQLEALRPLMAEVAQMAYDSWEQDEDGVDVEYGDGGICDKIDNDMMSVVSSNIADVDIFEGGQQGDDHAWSIVRLGNQSFGVDLSAWKYESGSGYSWKKRTGVTITPDMIDIFKIDLPEGYSEE
jgi:hypothetical protein